MTVLAPASRVRSSSRSLMFVCAGLTMAGAAALAGTAWADDAKPGVPGPTSILLLEATTHGDGAPLVYPAGKPKVTARVVEIGPGLKTNVHRHPIPLFAYILEGELTLHDASGSVRHAKAGEAFMESSGVHYGENESKTPVRLLAVYLGEEGAPLSVEVKQ
jgi:quercetin dioxygenase-like cupin family protein